MAARKAETETPGSNMSAVRAKSAVVVIDSKFEGTSSNPSYEAITQQIAYLMSAITNQNTTNNSARHNNGNGKIPNTKTQGSENDRKDRICWDVEVLDIGGRNVQQLDKSIISLLNQKLLCLYVLSLCTVFY